MCDREKANYTYQHIWKNLVEQGYIRQDKNQQ